jgi:predicted dehydrogenase
MGKLGLLHAGTFNVLPGCRLVAIVDKSDQVLRALQSKNTGIATYTSHQAMLDDAAPDVVAIATPTEQHTDIATTCVSKGAHIFIEKPLCLVPDDALPLIDALKQRPRVNMVGYMTRLMETFRKAKELIDLNLLGRLQMLRSSMYIEQLFRQGKGWRYDPAISGGGVLMTQNSHLVDMLLWMFGPVASVNAQASRLYSKQVEDHIHVFFNFSNGLKGFLDASWSARHFRTPTMRIHVQGERGTLDVDDDRVALFLVDNAGELKSGWHEWRKPDLYRGVPFDIGGTNYTAQAMQFLSAIRGSGTVESDVKSALEVQKVIAAAYRSADQNGAPVAVG